MIGGQRREHDRIAVDMEAPVDDTDPNRLTLSEIKELKIIANKSKTARELWALLLGLTAVIGTIAGALAGLPTVIDYLRAHWR